jgi:shikimate dehydrogenase
MARAKALADIARCLSNTLDAGAIAENALAGVIGDAPSLYSKSPRLWNAAFRHLGMNATYTPFDVPAAKVGDLLTALRNSDFFLGANVTVPHKVKVMKFLDELGPDARRIQAVNTIVRTANGRLIGYNTDGDGFVRSILQRQPDRSESFLPSLEKITVLLLGAGGSARAVAFHLADCSAGGKLLICNRRAAPALSLAQDVHASTGEAVAITEAELPTWAARADLIVNCTTKGQGGIRRLPDGRATLTEPYSALAPANPPVFAEADAAGRDFERRWRAAAADLEANHRASLELAKSIPAHVRFYDLVYHPEETVFLRHARLTGHAVMNGKGMIINQAVIAFCERVCRATLKARGTDTPATESAVLDVMYRAWSSAATE